MELNEVIDIIKSYKKYSTSNFVYGDSSVYYHLENITYTIEFRDRYRRRRREITFSHYPTELRVREISLSIVKEKCDRKKVLSKFGKIVKSINETDALIKSRQHYLEKVKPVIISVLKSQYNIDFDGNNIKMDFPRGFFNLNRKSPSNYIKEDDIRFNILIKNEKSQVSFNFIYDTKNKKLILDKREESYKGLSKDLTKIIRSEKLRNLLSKNEESN